MRILVIDDKEINRKSALQSLAGHEVTTCGDADEALGLLESKEDYTVFVDSMTRSGFPRIHRGDGTLAKEMFEGSQSKNANEKAAFDKAWDLARAGYGVAK